MITRTIFFLLFVFVAIQIFYQICQAKDYFLQGKSHLTDAGNFYQKHIILKKKREIGNVAILLRISKKKKGYCCRMKVRRLNLIKINMLEKKTTKKIKGCVKNIIGAK